MQSTSSNQEITDTKTTFVFSNNVTIKSADLAASSAACGRQWVSFLWDDVHKNCRNGSYYNTPLSTFGLCFKLKKDPVLEDPVFEGGEEVLGRDIN